MITLKSRLNNLNFSTQLDEVNKLLDKAQTKITFWGLRVVSVQGNEGYVPLDYIAEKILKASPANPDALTPEERIAGIEFIKKIKTFYRITDAEIKKSNLFSRLLNLVREFTFSNYATRFYIKGHLSFQKYSVAKHIEEFGHDPRFDPNDKTPVTFIVSEEKIRTLLIRI